MSLDLSNDVIQMIKEFGSDKFYIVREGDRPIDPDTGLPTGPKPQPARTKVSGILTGYSEYLVANSNIKTGDKQLVLPPNVDYRQGDKIEIYDGTLWAVVSEDDVNPSGIRQVLKLRIRPI